MRIPKRFKLMGRVIEVKYENQLLFDADLQGQARYRYNDILIQPRTADQPMPNMEITFCHELVHWLLYFAGTSYKGNRDYMHQEEGFVDTLAGLLHQALETMTYEEDTI